MGKFRVILRKNFVAIVSICEIGDGKLQTYQTGTILK